MLKKNILNNPDVIDILEHIRDELTFYAPTPAPSDPVDANDLLFDFQKELVNWVISKSENSLQLLEQLEGRYIITGVLSIGLNSVNYDWSKIHNGTITVWRRVYENRVVQGMRLVDIDLLQLYNRDELQRLLEQSIGQVEYEQYLNNCSREYERVTG